MVALLMCTRGDTDRTLCPNRGYHCADNGRCYSTSGVLEPSFCPAGAKPDLLKCGINADYACYDPTTRSCKNADGVSMIDPIGDIVSASNELYHTAMYYASCLFSEGAQPSTDEMKIKTNAFLQDNWAKLAGLVVSSSDAARIARLSTTVVQQTRRRDIDRELLRRREQLDRIRAAAAARLGRRPGEAGAGGGAARTQRRSSQRGGGGRKMTVRELLINAMLYNLLDTKASLSDMLSSSADLTVKTAKLDHLLGK